MAIWLTTFLKRGPNSSKAVIKDKRVNRGGGYGLEIPCTGDTFFNEMAKGKAKKGGI